jgi:Enoyl-CoA hydratase/carnithine racemase
MAKMQYAFEERIARITLDDGKMNVMNEEFFKELNDSLDQALTDEAAALIFTSRPGVFSAGLDLKLLMTQTLPEALKFQRVFADTMLRVYLFPIPTIAAYCGHSIAGGAILSYACDRFMAVDGPYKVQINEVANKMILPTWISTICRSAIPPRFWKEALLHAHMYTPREAYNKGIIDDLIDEGGDVLAAAKTYAQDLFRLDAKAYGATKKIMRQKEADYALEVFEKELLRWLL